MSGVFPVFITDLDGTLLDHDDYSYAAAQPAIDRLRERGWPLVLNSSKTRAEIEQLRRELNNRHPFVVENGAAVFCPRGYFAPSDAEPEGEFDVRRFGAARARILSLIRRLREERDLKVAGFADWSVEEIAERTGLTIEGAARAADRCCSEPLIFSDGPERLEWFQDRLDRAGLRTVQGGRFLHVMGRFDKADGVDWLRAQYERKRAGERVVVVALGDSPNDAGMLSAADYGVVVRSARSESVSASPKRRLFRTAAPGPAGWKEAVDELSTELL